MVILKSKDEIVKMREAGHLTALLLEKLEGHVLDGVATIELDLIAEKFILSNGGVPAFKGYHGYPNAITVSINEEVVHAIPTKRKIKYGDIVSLDVGIIYNGYVGDAAITVPVGDVGEEKRQLLDVTREALNRGIDQAKPGNHVGDISHAVQSHVESHGFSVVRDLVGHGIGRSMHEEPQVPNYGDPGVGVLLQPGMVLAIEPMVNMGGYNVEILKNKWTVVTADRKPSAHFEHTVAIMDNGPCILTSVN